MKNKRNSNLEILRILAILFIVISHYSVHNTSTLLLPVSLNRFFLEIIKIGDIGSILFILITGYFQIDKDKLNIKRLLLLYLEIIFYSLGIYLLFIILGSESFSIKSMIKNTLPLTFEIYWFMTAYFVIYIFSPFVNKFLNSLNEKEHRNFIYILLIIFSTIYVFTLKNFYASPVIQFLIYYSIGAYYKKYPKSILNNRKSIIILLCSTIIISLSIITIDITKLYSNSSYLLNKSSIFTILIAVSIFNIFLNKKEFYNKYINIISSCTLGVYLISDNPYVRNLLWKKIFSNKLYVNSNLLLIHMILSVFTIFVVTILIEYLRKITIEKIISDKINDFKKLYRTF